jgi:cytoskeletal protein RodZ
MAPPRAEPNRERSARRLRLWIGLLVGLTIGLPLGAAGMWAWRPRAQASAGPFDALTRKVDAEPGQRSPRSIAKTPPSTTPPPTVALTPPPEPTHPSASPVTPSIATVTPSTATIPPRTAMPTRANAIQMPLGAKAAASSKAPAAKSAEPILTAHVSAAETQPSAPPAAAELPAPPSVAPHRNGRIGTFHIESKPPGAEVTVKGEPRGPAPVDVELPPNHRYEILVEWPNGAKPWRHRINLKPPLTQVTAVAR